MLDSLNCNRASGSGLLGTAGCRLTGILMHKCELGAGFVDACQRTQSREQRCELAVESAHFYLLLGSRIGKQQATPWVATPFLALLICLGCCALCNTAGELKW